MSAMFMDGRLRWGVAGGSCLLLPSKGAWGKKCPSYRTLSLQVHAHFHLLYCAGAFSDVIDRFAQEIFSRPHFPFEDTLKNKIYHYRGT